MTEWVLQFLLRFLIFQQILDFAIKNITNFCQKIQIDQFDLLSFIIAVDHVIFWGC